MYRVSEYQNNTYLTPGEKVSPEKKASKEYRLAYSKSLYSAWLRNRLSGPLFKDREKMIKRRLYSIGKQDETQYMKMLLGHNADLESARKGWMNINYKVFNVASLYRKAFIGKFNSIVYATSLKSRSLTIMNENKERMWKMYAMQKVRSHMPDAKGGMSTEEGVEPQTLEELMMLEKLGTFNHKVEYAFQEFVEVVMQEGWNQQFITDILGDIWENHIACAVDYVDPNTGILGIKRVDYLNTMYRMGENNEVIEGGYLELMTINDLRCTGEFSEKELMEIAKSACGAFGNPWSWNYTSDYWAKPSDLGNCPWDDYRVLVQHDEQMCVDEYYYSENQNKPNKPIRREAYGYESKNSRRKRKIKERKNYYQNNWIVGTDYCYGYGPQENSPRPKLSEARCFLHVWEFDGPSPVEQCEPVFDQVHMDWLKYQNNKVTANPRGFAIDESILMETEIGGQFKPAEQIRMFRNNGVLLYRTTDSRGRPTMSPNAPPILELKGGAKDAVEEFAMSYNLMIQILEKLTGLTGPSVATPVEGKAINEMQLEATGTIMKPMLDGVVELKKSLATNILLRGILLLRHSEPTRQYYESILGSDVMAIIQMALDKNYREYGLSIRVFNNNGIMRELKQGAIDALAAGRNGMPGLEWIEFAQISMLIEQGASPQYIIALIGRIIDKRKKEAAALSQQSMAAQSESQAMMQAQIIEMQKSLDDHKSKNILGVKVGERAIDHYFNTKENEQQAISNVEQKFAGVMLEGLVGPLLQNVTNKVQPNQ